jgi:phosphatidylglycerol---prolipoprotein diacylglyceryl transferase
MLFEKLTTISIGPLTVQVWGLLVALGMLAGLIYTLREAKKKKMDTDNFIDLFILIFISSIIGSRLFYVAQNWDNYKDNLMSIISVNEGGMVILGGVLFAVLAILIYVKIKKLSFWKVADTIVPGFALGLGIGRIGCYLIGDHIGSRTDFFLGSYYQGDLRHEPSLYLSINGFVLFIVLILLAPFFRKKEAVLSYIFIIWYSLSRFILDFTRAADIEGISDHRYWNLTVSQWMCAVLFLVFTPLLIKKLVAKGKK